MPDAGAHDDGHLVDELAGARGDDGRAQYPVGTLGDMDLDEAGVLAIRDRPVDILNHHGEALDRDTLPARLPNLQADMGVSGSQKVRQGVAISAYRCPAPVSAFLTAIRAEAGAAW